MLPIFFFVDNSGKGDAITEDEYKEEQPKLQAEDVITTHEV